MQCSKCGKPSTDGLAILGGDPGFKYVCLQCQVASMPEIQQLEEAEEMIAELSAMKAKFESFVERFGSDGGEPVPDALEPFAFTPGKAFMAADAHLRNALQDRENILATMSERQRLEWALGKAVEKEDFEEAARIRALLDEAGT